MHAVAKKFCNFEHKTVLQKLLYPLILEDIINTLTDLSFFSDEDLLHSWKASVRAQSCDERSNFFVTEYLRPIKDDEENEYEPGDHYSPRDGHGWKHFFHILLDLYLSYIENCHNFPEKQCKSIWKEDNNRSSTYPKFEKAWNESVQLIHYLDAIKNGSSFKIPISFSAVCDSSFKKSHAPTITILPGWNIGTCIKEIQPASPTLQIPPTPPESKTTPQGNKKRSRQRTKFFINDDVKTKKTREEKKITTDVLDTTVHSDERESDNESVIAVTDSVLNISTPKESLPALVILKDIGFPHTFENTVYKSVPAQLTCEACHMLTNVETIVIFDDEYYDRCKKPDVWWETHSLRSFGLLMFHQTHEHDIFFMDCKFPNKFPNTKDPTKIVLPTSVRKVVTIANAKNHFVILLFDLHTTTVSVYDGRYLSLTTWNDHFSFIINKIDEKEKNWEKKHVRKLKDKALSQLDNSSCGPIACMVLWSIFNPCKIFDDAWKEGNENVSNHAVCRHNIVEEMKLLVKTSAGNLVFKCRQKWASEKLNKGTRNISENKQSMKKSATKSDQRSIKMAGSDKSERDNESVIEVPDVVPDNIKKTAGEAITALESLMNLINTPRSVEWSAIKELQDSDFYLSDNDLCYFKNTVDEASCNDIEKCLKFNCPSSCFEELKYTSVTETKNVAAHVRIENLPIVSPCYSNRYIDMQTRAGTNLDTTPHDMQTRAGTNLDTTPHPVSYTQYYFLSSRPDLLHMFDFTNPHFRLLKPQLAKTFDIKNCLSPSFPHSFGPDILLGTPGALTIPHIDHEGMTTLNWYTSWSGFNVFLVCSRVSESQLQKLSEVLPVASTKDRNFLISAITDFALYAIHKLSVGSTSENPTSATLASLTLELEMFLQLLCFPEQVTKEKYVTFKAIHYKNTDKSNFPSPLAISFLKHCLFFETIHCFLLPPMSSLLLPYKRIHSVLKVNPNLAYNNRLVQQAISDFNSHTETKTYEGKELLSLSSMIDIIPYNLSNQKDVLKSMSDTYFYLKARRQVDHVVHDPKSIRVIKGVIKDPIRVVSTDHLALLLIIYFTSTSSQTSIDDAVLKGLVPSSLDTLSELMERMHDTSEKLKIKMAEGCDYYDFFDNCDYCGVKDIIIDINYDSEDPSYMCPTCFQSKSVNADPAKAICRFNTKSIQELISKCRIILSTKQVVETRK